MGARRLLVLAVVGLTGCSGSQTTLPPDPIPSLSGAFQARLGDYLEPEWLSPPSGTTAPCAWFPDLHENFPDEACGLQGSVTGSVVSVDAKTRQIAPEFLAALAYPDRVDALAFVERDGGTPISLASAPADVDTVVLLWSSTTEAAAYLDGTKGYRVDDAVKIVDLGAQAVVGETVIKGASPPRTKREGNWPGVAPWDGLLTALSCAADPTCS